MGQKIKEGHDNSLVLWEGWFEEGDGYFPSPLELGHQLRKKSALFAGKKSRLDIRKSFLLIRRVRWWNRLPRFVLDLILWKVSKAVLHRHRRQWSTVEITETAQHKERTCKVCVSSSLCSSCLKNGVIWPREGVYSNESLTWPSFIESFILFQAEMGGNRKSFISGINYFPFNFLQSKSHMFFYIFSKVCIKTYFLGLLKKI